MFTVGGTGGPGLENTDLEQEYETQSTEGFSSARGNPQQDHNTSKTCETSTRTHGQDKVIINSWKMTTT